MRSAILVSCVLVLSLSSCCGSNPMASDPAFEERSMELLVVPKETKEPETNKGPQGEDADWLRSSGTRGGGHCTPDEIALFDCATGDGKQLSLCGTATLETMQYRFGPVGSPELVHPDDTERFPMIHGHEAWARGEEHSVSFTRGDHTYRVVSASGSGIEGELNNYEGVQVYLGEEMLTFVACATAANSELTRLESILGGGG